MIQRLVFVGTLFVVFFSVLISVSVSVSVSLSLLIVGVVADVDTHNDNANLSIHTGGVRHRHKHRHGSIQRQQQRQRRTLQDENDEQVVAVSSGSSAVECASTPNYGGSCDITTADGTVCGYNYVDKGCHSTSTSLLEEEQEQEVDCRPTLTCTCNLFNEGTWMCADNAMSHVCPEGTIASETRGQVCLPPSTSPLSTLSALSTTTDNEGEGEGEAEVEGQAEADIQAEAEVETDSVENVDDNTLERQQQQQDTATATDVVADADTDTDTDTDVVADTNTASDMNEGIDVGTATATATIDDTAIVDAGTDTDTATTATATTTTTTTTNNKNVVPISFYGLNYNTRKGPDWFADRERCKSREEIVRDLTVLARVTTRIRLLALVDCNQGRLVWSILNQELASTKMQMWLGLWVGPDPIVFQQELEALEVILQDSTNTDSNSNNNYDFSQLLGISVGSEAIYREDVTVQEAINNMEATQTLLAQYNVPQIPTTIVEIAPIYSKSSQLRNAVDTIMTNTFPFWESIPIDNAVDNLDENLSWLLGLPEVVNKPFVLGEHGWPSEGYIEGVGVASPQNQQQYMQDSYCYLHIDKEYPYYLFTSIDNDWRQLQDPNNSIEGNWGFLHSDLTLKAHFVDYDFTCDNNKDNESTTYSFGAVDWSIPELPDVEIDNTTSSCQLWSGCEALAGDCCPTPNQNYLGCCRDEFFLGSTTTTTSDNDSDSDTTIPDTTAIDDVPNDGNDIVSTTAPSIAPVPATTATVTTIPSTVPAAATTTTTITTSSPTIDVAVVVVSPTDAPTIKSTTTTITNSTTVAPTLAPISSISISTGTPTESPVVVVADPVDIVDTTTTATTTTTTTGPSASASASPTTAPIVVVVSKDGTINPTRESGDTQTTTTTTTINPWNENEINSSEVSSSASAVAAYGGIGGINNIFPIGGAVLTIITAYIVVVVVFVVPML